MGEDVHIGRARIAGGAVLAPLAGLTDRAFRLLCREQGAGLAVTEMVSARGLAEGSERSSEYLDFDGEEHPISVQVFGAEPAVMAEAARVIADRTPDLIDINCGCPVRKIVNRHAGAALMREPGRLAAIVSAMVRAVSIPITVKIRSGWEDGAEAVAVARAAEDAGAAAIAIHGRTRAAKFSGEANWAAIGRVKAAVGIPVIGNGDVRTGEDARRMRAATGCDLVMVGRAAVGNPWIFRAIRRGHRNGPQSPDPTVGQRVEMAIRHLGLAVEAKGRGRGVREMRKCVPAYVKGLRGSAAIRRELTTEEEPEAVAAILRRLVQREAAA